MPETGPDDPAPSPARIDAARARLLAHGGAAADIVREWPVASFLAAFDGHDPYLGYGYLPAPVLDQWQRVIGRHGEDSGSAYLALILLDLIETFPGRVACSGLTAPFLPEFHGQLNRILTAIETMDDQLLSLDSDLFLKDLGLCRMILIPCVTHLIYRHAGVPRRLVLSQRLPGMIRALWFLGTRTGGARPFLENHVHLSMRAEFTEDGRKRCYRLVAELLRLWPEARGLVGSSWYYDPVIPRISPRIGYLRLGPERAGALFLENGGGAAARGALSRSPTRRRLHDEGRYEPRNYFMIWARRDIIRHHG